MQIERENIELLLMNMVLLDYEKKKNHQFEKTLFFAALHENGGLNTF
jgi:hypothetical protein